jgi:pimeloyl-ACP methyl ester carboxylesterase
MRRLLPLLVLLAIPFASAAHADGCPPSTCGTTSVAPPGSNLAFVFPQGRQGPLRVYDLQTGRKRFAFPSGMLSADGRVFVSAVQSPHRTRFVRYDTGTGRGRTLRTLPGSWGVVGVSADGRRIADGIPEARLVVLDRCSHLAHVEQPVAVGGLIEEHMAA